MGTELEVSSLLAGFHDAGRCLLGLLGDNCHQSSDWTLHTYHQNASQDITAGAIMSQMARGLTNCFPVRFKAHSVGGTSFLALCAGDVHRPQWESSCRGFVK